MSRLIAITLALGSLSLSHCPTIAGDHSHGNDVVSSHQAPKGEYTVDAAIQLIDGFKVGSTLTTKLTLKDTATKKPLSLEDLQEAHTKKIHLLIFDKTLEDYQHVHPEPTDTAGEYQFSWTPTKPGPYRFWVDIVPLKTGAQELIKVDLQDIDFPKDVTAVKTLSQKATVEGLTYQLSFDQPSLEVGKPAMGTVEITQADGTPFTQLEPIMETFAHIVALHEDFESLEHIHPMGVENPGSAERGGPKLQFHINASKAGFLKIYVQVKIDGKEQFIPFGVEVKERK